jgi:uncharacterized protein (TIGR03085 family)
MSATDVLMTERADLCDTFDAVGPTAPTLCEGWLAQDLAAHLIVRERHPTASPGILLGGPFRRRTEAMMRKVAAEGFDTMIATLRAGPPWLHRVPMARVNVVEMWVHHEDLRRAQGWTPRPPDPPVDDLLWRSTAASGFMAGRRVRGVGLELDGGDDRRRVLRRSEPRVVVRGAPGEIVLFLYGRKEAAAVELDGPPDGVALVRAARLGI